MASNSIDIKANTDRILLLYWGGKKMEMQETEAEELEWSEMVSNEYFNFLVQTLPRIHSDVRAKKIGKLGFIPFY